MTIYKWIGGTAGSEGDVNTAANWLPATVPTAGHTILFDIGGQPVTTSLDHFQGVELVEMIIKPGAPTLGTATEYFETGDVELINIQATQPAWLDVGSDSPVINILDSGRSFDGDGSGITVRNDTGPVGTVSISGGTVSFGDGKGNNAIIKEIWMTGGLATVNTGCTFDGAPTWPRYEIGSNATMRAHVIGAGIVAQVSGHGTLYTDGPDQSGGIIAKDWARCYLNHTGTTSALSIHDKAMVTTLGSAIPRTINAFALYGGEFHNDETITTVVSSTVVGRKITSVRPAP